MLLRRLSLLKATTRLSSSTSEYYASHLKNHLLRKRSSFSRCNASLSNNSQNFTSRKMNITPIPCLGDNYSYLLHCRKTNEAAVIDPVEPTKVLAVVKEQNANVKAVLTTHHHADHSGGNEDIVKQVPGLDVYGYGDGRIPALTKKVTHQDKFKIGDLAVTCLFTPCHTTGHICYYVESGDEKAVFTGDTLFVGGCGRFFEGTAAQMTHALVDILGSLAPETKVYCGHEYTTSNLKFALKVEPDNEDLKKKVEWANSVKCTVPSTIGEELKTNPFMRLESSAIQTSTERKDSIEVMHVLREMKNNM